MNEYIKPSDFEEFLDQQKGERGMSSFLEKRPQILYWCLCGTGGHTRFVFREFPIGTQYVADYVVVNSYSGLWQVKFVELEPVDDLVFTKKGTPTKRFAEAIKQADDWAEYFENNKNQIRQELVRWAKDKDILGYDSDDDNPVNYSGNYLVDPNSSLWESFHIIIGRRDKLSSKSHHRKATYHKRHNIDVRSYDMLLDLVNTRYANSEYWQKIQS
jgi:hypothetical protein